ncbi:MAG TPA: hypothetical protein VF219_08550 [Vicinamibacterales bacterium]
MKNSVAFLFALAVLVAMAGSSAAQPKPNVFDQGNRWLITAYSDDSPVHAQMATQGICFLPYAVNGTQIQGVWFSDTFPNWRGHYAQEGDRVLMHGDYAGGVGHDGMETELFAGTSPQDEGGGQWTEWRSTGGFGTTIVFANDRLRRVGKCVIRAGADLAKMSRADIEKLAEEESAKVRPRLRRDGKAADSPTDPEQVPLPEQK